MKRTYRFLADPGHAWLSVPRKDVKALGVEPKITKFSYVRENRAYLEEDCDASTFLNAAKAAGWEVTLKSSYNENSPIRGYARFAPLT